MASVGTYLTFAGQTEAAFDFYRSVFGGEFIGGIHRFSDMPPDPNCPPIPDAERQGVMHVALEITGGHRLMGSDTLSSMGPGPLMGNNIHISLTPDTRAEGDRLFAALSAGGQAEHPMADMFWGAYFGSLTDRFGIRWMINVEPEA